MLKKSITLFTILLVITGTTGCIGPRSKPQVTSYYTLDYTAPAFENLPNIPVTLQVQRFQISPDYNTEKIVFSKSAFNRDQYNYRRWRSNPRDLVTYLISRDLRETGLFSGIFSPESFARASHRITGTVDAFYEKDGTPWHAVVTLGVTLLKSDELDVTQRVVFQKTYEAEIPCEEDTTNAFVAAMGECMRRISTSVINDTYHHLSDNKGSALQP